MGVGVGGFCGSGSVRVQALSPAVWAAGGPECNFCSPLLAAAQPPRQCNTTAAHPLGVCVCL